MYIYIFIQIVEVQGDIQYVGEVIKDDPENVIATEEPKSPVSDDSSGAANVNQLENPVDVKAEEMDEVGAIEILPPNSEIQEEKCNNLKETMKDEPTVDREESPIRRYLDDTTDEG